MDGINNIRHSLIIALGNTPRLDETIEKQYAKNPKEYYQAFRESGFFNDILFYNFPFERYNLLVEGATNRSLQQMQFDYIAFRVSRNSHGAYYRIRESFPSSKIIYLNKANIEQTMKEMYNQIAVH